MSTILREVETRCPPDLGPAAELSCKECGTAVPLSAEFACPNCWGPLEVGYRFGRVTRADIESGPSNIWRYRALLPVPEAVREHRGLAVGLTPLHRADRLADVLGVERLWIKDDTANPTHSFKDRVVAVAISAARELGFRVLCCPSTGNLANAVAAAAARAGWRSVVLVPSTLERAKIVMTAAYGGTLVAVDGSYDDINRIATQIAEIHDDWAFVNVNVRPFYAEGSKTIGFEMAEQLGWRLPDQVIVPIASGSQLTKIDKGFRELVELGLVEDRECIVHGAQAAGCSPVQQAFENGESAVRPVQADTIAKSLAIGTPADGANALRVVRSRGGRVAAVPDEQIREAIGLLARTEGVFAETAGGVTVACALEMARRGELRTDGDTVLTITGDGLKTLDAVPDELTAAPVVAPRTAAVLAAADADMRVGSLA